MQPEGDTSRHDTTPPGVAGPPGAPGTTARSAASRIGPLGAAFARAAKAPLEAAARALGQAQVREALEAMEPTALRKAVRRGAEAVAAAAGVSVSAVEPELPGVDLEDAHARFVASHAAAVEVWRAHAERLGGFLPGVADVTNESEQPDVGWYLSRLAGKVVRDKKLSGPLDDLAADVTRWEQIIERASGAIDAARRLATARRWRRVRAVAVVAVAAIAACVAGGLWLRARATRERIERALGATDPCAARIPADDATRATEDDRRRDEEHARTCDAQRARAARVAACEGLVTHVEAGALAPEDSATAGEARALLERVAGKTLTAADLGVEPVFPCGDAAAGARLLPAFARAAAASTAAWDTVEVVADGLATALREGKPPLSPEAIERLDARADATAKEAVFKGAAEAMVKGERLCGLETRVGITPRRWCKGLEAALAKSRARGRP